MGGWVYGEKAFYDSIVTLESSTCILPMVATNHQSRKVNRAIYCLNTDCACGGGGAWLTVEHGMNFSIIFLGCGIRSIGGLWCSMFDKRCEREICDTMGVCGGEG